MLELAWRCGGYACILSGATDLVEFLGALRGLPVRIDADTGEVEVGLKKMRKS